jgi:hypothetical protein
MTTATVKNVTQQPQSIESVVAIICLGFLIPILTMFNLHDYNFVDKLSGVLIIIFIITSIRVMWKYSVPEKEGFISKVFQCCKDGFLVVLCVGVFFIFLGWLFNISSPTYFVVSLLITSLLAVSGNKKIIRGNKTFERTWFDAIVITMAQLIFVFTVVFIIALIFRKIMGGSTKN